MDIDPYLCLGLSPGASQRDVRAAYRRLALELHPDRLMHAPAERRRQAEQRLKDVNAAYRALRSTARSAPPGPRTAPPRASRTAAARRPTASSRRPRRARRMAYLAVLMLSSAGLIGWAMTAARPDAALIAVHSSPPASHVSLDGAPLGLAPTLTSVSPGSHHVTVTRPGCSASGLAVWLEAEEYRSLRFRLDCGAPAALP